MPRECVGCGDSTDRRIERDDEPDVHVCSDCWDNRGDKLADQLAEDSILTPEALSEVMEAFHSVTDPIFGEHSIPGKEIDGAVERSDIRRTDTLTIGKLAGFNDHLDGKKPIEELVGEVTFNDEGTTSVNAAMNVRVLPGDYRAYGVTAFLGDATGPNDQPAVPGGA